MKCAWLGAALGAAFGLGCGDPFTAQTTQLTLDRPVDVAFACYGRLSQDGEPTAQPTAECERWSPPLQGDPQPDPAVSIRPSWYTFILQSASGTVAVATSTPEPAETMMGGVSDFGGDYEVLDADPLTPGKNAITVGEDPVAIATDRAGCFVITANAGSCDFSALEINSALDDIDDIPPVPGKPVRVDRVQVTNATATPILAKPAAMVAEPGTTAAGSTCPATATGRVWVAYPSCHLVAGIDAATGKIMAGIAFAADGTPSILSGAALDNVTCPAECTSAGGAASGSITPGVRPVALDLNTSRLAIGADNSRSLTLVELDPATSVPMSVSQVALEDRTGKLGVTAVALSPQIAMGGEAPRTGGDVGNDGAGGQGQYVYAVATDNTVRVADVLSLDRECDTQIDGRFLREGVSVTDRQCLPIGDPVRPRRSGARSPGIELPGDAVPISVAIVKARESSRTTTRDANNQPQTVVLRPGPTTWLGYFAIIAASSGAVYVANVDDDYAPDEFSAGEPLSTAPVLVMAHQLRDSFFSRGEGPPKTGTNLCQTGDDPPAEFGAALGGGPRIPDGPAQVAPAGTINLANVLPLPAIRQVACTLDMAADPVKNPVPVPVSELAFGAPPATRDQVYPDLRSVTSETWTLTWEGTLSLDNVSTSIDGPMIRTGQIVVDSKGMRITDPAQPFCDIGVEPFDVVDLRGCNPANGDGDCPSGYTCFVHPQSVGVGVGACMLASEAPRLADACFPFLTTRRRYTVGQSVASGELVLLERRHELATTPVDGCIDDNQCNQLAQDAAKIDASAPPFTSRTQWTCQTDPLRAPINADPARNKRCIQACSTDPAHPWDCANGTICRPLTPGGTEGVCLEGVQPPQACVNGPQRYDVRASEAFTVIGSQSGYVHPFIKQPGGVACVRDPAAQPVQIGRIPIDPLRIPACLAADAVDPITGQVKGQPGVFEPNPCSLLVDQFDAYAASTTAPACTTDPTPLSPAQTRSALAIKFRNRAMTLTLVDPYQTCLPNNQGSAANVPLVIRGYQLEFVQRAGFSALQLPAVGPAYPVKVVRGPTDSIWVIDAGDSLSTSFGEAPTRGRVYRVESVDVSIINLLR